MTVQSRLDGETGKATALFPLDMRHLAPMTTPCHHDVEFAVVCGMTDRLKGFIVTFDCDIREDDAENLSNAILMLKGVADVKPVVADYNDYMNRVRVENDIMERIYRAIRSGATRST